MGNWVTRELFMGVFCLLFGQIERGLGHLFHNVNAKPGQRLY